MYEYVVLKLQININSLNLNNLILYKGAYSKWKWHFPLTFSTFTIDFNSHVHTFFQTLE